MIYSVSGVQRSDSVIHTYIYIILQILFFYRLLQDTEYSSLCYTVGPCYLSILYIVVSINPKFLIYTSRRFPFGNHKFVSYVCESISVLQISSFVSFFLDSTYKWYHMIFVFLWKPVSFRAGEEYNSLQLCLGINAARLMKVKNILGGGPLKLSFIPKLFLKIGQKYFGGGVYVF